MNTQTKQAALARVCERVISALPDSLSERKQVLHDLLTLNPPGTPRRAAIQKLLIHLHDQEIAQLQFSELMNGGAQ